MAYWFGVSCILLRQIQRTNVLDGKVLIEDYGCFKSGFQGFIGSARTAKSYSIRI